MKPDKWTQQLHDKLADHETPAPADLWADIEAALPQQPRRSRFVTLRRWAVAATVAVLLGGGALVWFGHEKEQTELLAGMAEQRVDIQDEMLLEEEPLDKELPDEDSQSAEIQIPSKVQIQSSPHHKQRTRSLSAVLDETSVSQYVAEETLITHQETEETLAIQPKHEEEYISQSKTEKPIITQTLPFPETPSYVSDPRHATPKPSLGLYAMNGFSSELNSNPVQMADALANSFANTDAASHSASRQAPIYLTGYEERQHHKQPVAFGLTLSYPLARHLTLTSGIVYTRLKSEFTQIARSQHIYKEQTLQYVGIPLSVSYRLWQYKGLKTYLSAGMQTDWNVKARMKTEGVRQKMGLDHLQWSVNGSLGLQYDLLPQLSLYVEPGINHYFDNGSVVQNFFKDKPTSLKLQLGIRLNMQ